MDLASRKGIYRVVGITDETRVESEWYKDETAARYLYDKWFAHYHTVLFCTRKPTVTKGQIDPDLY